jgi:hypothetical protein
MNIVECLAIESAWVREFADRAFIVRMPFPIFPHVHSGVPGQYNLEWHRTRILDGLIPRNADGSLRATDARAPFPRVILMSEQDETGALFVQESPKGLDVGNRLIHGRPVTRLLRARLVGSLGSEWARFAWETVIIVAGDATEEIMFPGGYDNRLEFQTVALQEVNPDVPVEQLRWAIQPDRGLTEQHVTLSLAVAFTLLNTKNIVQERVDPRMDRATRRRIDRGERAAYTYYTLKHRPFGKRTGDDGAGSGGSALVALHVARGHFKTYTEAAPLFGKYTGRWWWEPHVRGNDSEHVIDKDYSIEI